MQAFEVGMKKGIKAHGYKERGKGTKVQSHIGTKKEREKGTKVRGTKGYRRRGFLLCAFVPLSLCP
jgi:hypothetical protein